MDRARFERLLVQQTSRRRLIAGGAAVTGLAVAASFRGRPTRSAFVQATPDGSPAASPDATPYATPVASPVAAAFADYPFTLGVASGDPLPDGFVLWTRLAPSPLEDDGLGGLAGQAPIEVAWEVSTDEAFTNGNIVQRGTAIASPDLAYSVHADVTGLEPAREYFYRFLAGGEASPVGRTRTAPTAGAAVQRLRFAFASCSMWEHGYFNAYRDIAQSDLDLVFHLGDYFYEYEATGYAIPEGPVRTVTGPETVNLLDYRNRHALYKTDPDLQAAHAAAPWVVTWDDHETENDYAGAMSENGDPVERFLLRRANAYQAYYEHLPLRPESMPQGPDMQLYRRLGWGNLAEFQVLDTRQYRSDQPCGDGVQVRCPAALDPATTMLGPDQERWLLEGLDASTATWNVLAQQLMMARMEQMEGPGEKFWGDGWDMYTAARTRILSHVMSRGIPNAVVITGDIHTAWANDLKADFEDVESPTIGSEYICTSVSAGGSTPSTEDFAPYLPENPHIKFFDGAHGGYTRVDLTPERWQAEFLTVTDLRDPASSLTTTATYVTEAGTPGVKSA
jgi:alkaline phosphatase D